MGLWGDFTNAISSVAKVGGALSGTGAQVKSLTGGGAYLSEDEKAKEQELQKTVKNALSATDAALSNAPGFGVTKKAAKWTGDVLLQGASILQNKVLSPYVFRPVSTLGLLTDVNSPLYKKGEYEEGFQLNDIKAAYNRSAKVSAFQALTKSDLIIGVKPLSSIVLSTGGIKLDKVDLWDDKSIENNYVDNAVGRWFTGIGDFVVGNAALGGVGKGIGAIAKVGGTKAGVYTAKKTVEELAADMETGIAHASSNGTMGTQTVSGSHVVALAESKDYGLISDIVEKYSTNGRLVQLIHDATDPTAVKDMILADKGDLAAMERLAKTAPDDLFDLSDTASQITNNFIQTGKIDIADAGLQRLKTAYDAAIAKNPQYVKLRQAFLDDDYNPIVGAKDYMPAEPIIGRSALIKGQGKIREVKANARFRESSILETTIGGRVATRLVKFATRQGEHLPMGHVTFSGMRPFDGRIELNAFLNNIKLFKDGAKDIVVKPNGETRKVADLRRDWEQRYMASAGANEVKVLEEIDAEIGQYIGYKAGIMDELEMKQHVNGFRRNINRGLDSIKANGMAVGYDGRRMEASAQTIRQLNESYRFTPWDSIETKLDRLFEESSLKLKGKQGVDLGRQFFTDLNRMWTFDVLVRPMYAIKQSIGEPLVSATISQGMDFIWKDAIGNVTNTSGMLGRLGKNIGNWGATKGINAVNRTEKAAVNKLVQQKKDMLITASHNKDLLQVEVERLMRPGGSPGVKRAHLNEAKKELAAAQSILDKIELDIRAAVIPYGKAEAMPTLSLLERRVAFIKSKPSISKANKDKMLEAEAAIARYKDVIDKMATNSTVIRDADNALAAAYDQIDNVVAALKPALKEQADVFGKTAEFKKRYYSKENQIRIINGEAHTIDSFVSGESNFASAIRGETSNALTADMTYLGEQAVGTRAGILRRKIPPTTIKVTDPEYFAELEHIANRLIRQDPLMDQILAGKSFAELTKWSKTEEGIRYLEHFDIYEPKQVPAYLADKVGLIERMFPSIEVRTAILEREVTATELQQWLGGKIDELYDIAPTNFAYGVADAGLGANPYQVISNTVNQSVSRMYRKMASVENPIRNAFFDRVAADNVARRAQALMDQGVTMTPERFNALRQAAGREALQELEKTIYTVRRQNRLLHNARFAVAFPTAAVNAFYRYGRLAAKNPVGFTKFAYNYERTFRNFGVDENGNPTTDINEITHLIVPGTPEISKFFGGTGDGAQLNSRSLGFLLNSPSPSFVTSLSVGTIMKEFPGTEDGIKEALNMGGTNLYDTFFPYGAPTSIGKTFTPPWANALWNAAVGPEGKSDYLASWTSVYNYHKMLNEMGIEKKFPTDAEIRKEVRTMWGIKFLSGFISPAGVPFKVEMNKMRLPVNLYFKLLDKNRALGMSEQEARDAAGDEMLATMGSGFMLDRITASSNNRNLTIPATYESYKRVFDDNDALVGELASIDADSIGIVGLLTADLSRDSEQQSNNIINILKDPKLTLPGTSKNITNLRLAPQEAEAQRIKNRTWQEYTLVRDALEAKITDGRTLRAHPELKAVLDELAVTTFKAQSPEWYDEFQLSASGDKSYKYAKALNVITNNSQFMTKSGTSQFWKDAKFFVQARNMVATFYQSLPDYDPRKSQIKDIYNVWVQETAEQWDPNFKTIVKNYFDNDTLKAVI